ncbi:MAG: DUF1592 domain-containing protein [Planctomycetota bacterium]
MFLGAKLPPIRWFCLWLGCAVAAAAPAGTADAGEAVALGERVYRESCIDCHGEQGEGSDYYSIPLTGDLPPSQLATYIANTMPEGDAEACEGEDAEAVAQYLYDAFYSPFAQARNRPPRRELSRLTVRQYEQTLADLVASFLWRPEWKDNGGLTARFIRKRNVAGIGKPAKLHLPGIDFRLSELTELDESFRDPEAKTEAQFGNDRVDVHVWVSGVVRAPVTGVYEFFVQTNAGAELTINHQRVIDAGVALANGEEERARVKLLGGRVYELKLSSGRISKDDLTLRLGWRRPGGVDETIPARHLSTGNAPAIAVTEARFPPDDRSVGYVRGASISPEWHEAITNAALETTAELVEQIAELEGDREEPVTRDEARSFCEEFAARAFRRPLTDDERWRFVDRHFQSGDAADETVSPLESSLLSVLKSPRFLYPEIGYAAADAPPLQRAAGRLALALWDSLPDDQLAGAAREGWLGNPGALDQQAERMVNDRRTKAKVNEFFRHWLHLDETAELTRDPEAFPDFGPRVAADMRTSLEMLLDQVVWRGDADLRQLFLSEELFVNARLAKFLDVDAPTDAARPDTFVRAAADTRQRSGVVSHPFMLTSLAYYRDTSPIHRGVFLARHLLGRSLRPPPEAVAPIAPELAPDMTTRERVTLQTSPHQCQACHVLINDLGFTLEQFDAVGRFRSVDVGKPVDTSGGYVATDGSEVRIGDSRELAEYLANSPDVHRSFVTQLFEHLTKQPMLAYGSAVRDELSVDFRQNNFNIRRLIARAAVAAARAN